MKALFPLFFLLCNFCALAQIHPPSKSAYDFEAEGYFSHPVKTNAGIVCSDNLSSSLYLLKKDSLLTLTTSPGCGLYFNVSPDRNLIGYKHIDEKGMQSPALLNVNTGEIKFLHSPALHCSQVSFTHNGSVAFAVENTLFLVHNSGNMNFGLGVYSNICPVSPDGKFVAFSFENNIRLMELPSGEIIEITHGEKKYVYPKWSPDGRKLLFSGGNDLLVWDAYSGEITTLGRGCSASWSPDSKKIVFQKNSIEDFTGIESDLFLINSDGTNEIQLTSTGNTSEMNPSFSDGQQIIYHTYNTREIRSLSLINNNASSGQKLFSHPAKLNLKYFNTSQFYSKSPQSIVHLQKPTPYVHQKYDTPDWHNGSGSCAPTAAAMAIAYYNRLPKWPTLCNAISPHISNYGSYVADMYRFNEFYYNDYTTAYSTDAWGGYAFMWQTNSSPYNGGMTNYLIKHDLTTNQVTNSSCTFSQTVTEIDGGYPHMLCVMLTSAGHLVLAIGYVQGQQTVITNDPYGNKNMPGYPNQFGADSYYDWPGQNNGYVNLDATGSYGVVAWTCKARSTEVTYNDTLIDDVFYNHGFYIHNQSPSHQKYYRDSKTAGYNGHMWWTGSVTTADVCYATWTPNLPNDGLYEVSAYIPSSLAEVPNAQYRIFYDGGMAVVPVNQSAFPGQWVSLGTHPFLQGTSGYVYLGDSTGVAGLKVAFDAVKFSYAGLSLNITQSNVLCNGDSNGTISINPANGVPPFTYTWSSGQTASTLNNLQSGTYNVSVYDSNNDSAYASITILQPDTMSTSEDIQKPSVAGGSDGSIINNISGGTPPYSFSWSNGATTESINNLSSGNYSITVTDANGCTKIQSYMVNDPSCDAPSGLISNGITMANAQLSWDPADDALKYLLQYKKAGDTSWTSLSSVTDFYNLSGLAAGTGYIWQVASICGTDTSAFAGTSFTTNYLGNSSTYECSGHFTDSGGDNGDYSDNESYTFTIAPSGATNISITFTSFNAEANYDTLFIYDGPSTNSPLVSSNTGAKSIFTVLSSGGALTFKFKTDYATVKSGWTADWTSYGGSCVTNPSTNITVPAGWDTTHFTASFSDSTGADSISGRFYLVTGKANNTSFSNSFNGFANDDFSGMDTSWKNFSGTWDNTSTANSLSQTDAAHTNSNLYKALKQDSVHQYMYSWKMMIAAGGTTRRAGLYIFSDDSTGVERGNSYLAWFRPDNGTVQLWKNINNIDYLVTQDKCTFSSGTWYDIKMLCQPGNGLIQLFFDDKLISQWKDSLPHKTGDFISLRTSSCAASFDDIRVYKSRGTSAQILVGNSGSEDVPFQNGSPADSSCYIHSIVLDNENHFSSTNSSLSNIDWTPPAAPVNVNDGTGNDIDTTITAYTLSANWNSSTDVNSGIKSYWYAVGSTPGGTDIIFWNDNSIDTSVIISSLLNLTNGGIYYFSVMAENNAGLFSSVTTSDGQFAYILPHANFMADNTIFCVGDSVVMVNNSQNSLNYQWNFYGPDTMQSNQEHPQFYFATSGVYTVELIAINSVGADTFFQSNYISVNPNPIAAFTAMDTLLQMPNSTALFTNGSENASSYQWSFGDGGVSSDAHPYHIYNDTGTFFVMLICSNGLCPEDTATVIIRVVGTTGIMYYSGESQASVLPNPATGIVQLSFDLMKQQEVCVFLFNSTGQEILCLAPKKYRKGRVRLPLDLSMYSSGIYILKVITEEKTNIIKLVVENGH